MSRTKKTIYLNAKKDAAIIAWHNKIKNSYPGDINGYERFAVKYFIQNNKCTCIAKIHAPKEEFENVTLNFYIGDQSAMISQWLLQIENHSVLKKPSYIIKEILRRSIEVVSDDEPEWLPSLSSLTANDDDILSEVSRLIDMSSYMRPTNNSFQTDSSSVNTKNERGSSGISDRNYSYDSNLNHTTTNSDDLKPLNEEVSAAPKETSKTIINNNLDTSISKKESSNTTNTNSNQTSTHSKSANKRLFTMSGAEYNSFKVKRNS